ncbi:MAG: thiolase family protein, partial [Kiritimatiellia bacterium]|nr:thiolase family protein [Kiritimatiellia bacterium]
CFKQEITAVNVPQKKGDPLIVDHDEGIKPNTTVAGLAALKPVFKKDGAITAGNASTINDGAAAMVLMSADKAGELGIKPLARIKAYAAAGCDPQIMGIGPVPATQRLLQKTGMALADFDLIELNEAFAAQALAVLREWKSSGSNVNVQGGAIALGHPTGATGSILIVKLLHMMKRRNARNGLVTLCIGGGQGMAIALENIN